MNIRAHYDLPYDFIVDVEIQKPKECEGHIVSILAKKGKDGMTKYILKPTYFEEIIDSKINVNTYKDSLPVSTEIVAISISSSLPSDFEINFFVAPEVGECQLNIGYDTKRVDI